ncbi:MAG: saccharopine dehydrogenase NADP-binding domain-containing protein [Gammaproteobacteria bacterium]|nr:saccharopine dehydrogenase NADP-binding domain-containing protein [Gammaproteobacteria bacterium]
MPNVLLLGAGFVTGPIVEYFSKKNHKITVASQFLSEAEALCKGRYNTLPIQLDVTDQDAIRTLIKDADIVMSFVPYQFHVSIARICIDEQKCMVTASYTSKEMRELSEQAKAAGITILNEIGLDPGIDHMTAMQVIDEAHEKGGKVTGFVSWCGGIPAPSSNNNPLGYKFSWSPMAVLLAVLNDAHYLYDGKPVAISRDNLLTNMSDVNINDSLHLKGYPNRDSVSYKSQYKIPDVQTLLRGTLRYPGFDIIINAAKKLGLLSSEILVDKNISWYQLMNDMESNSVEKINDMAKQAFEWLGCYSEQTIKGQSPIDCFCNLLLSKLQYQSDEQDMIVMQHRILVESDTGEKQYHISTLIEEGDVGGYSAMAKTVGYPAAIAADLILSGTISRKGVCIPVEKDIYVPIMKELEKTGIKMIDTVFDSFDESDFFGLEQINQSI